MWMRSRTRPPPRTPLKRPAISCLRGQLAQNTDRFAVRCSTSRTHKHQQTVRISAVQRAVIKRPVSRMASNKSRRRTQIIYSRWSSSSECLMRQVSAFFGCCVKPCKTHAFWSRTIQILTPIAGLIRILIIMLISF